MWKPSNANLHAIGLRDEFWRLLLSVRWTNTYRPTNADASSTSANRLHLSADFGADLPVAVLSEEGSSRVRVSYKLACWSLDLMAAPTVIDLETKKLAVALHASGKTYREVSEELGVSGPSVWCWVNGARQGQGRPGAKPECMVQHYKARQWQPPVTGSAFIRPLPLERLMAGR